MLKMSEIKSYLMLLQPSHCRDKQDASATFVSTLDLTVSYSFCRSLPDSCARDGNLNAGRIL